MKVKLNDNSRLLQNLSKGMTLLELSQKTNIKMKDLLKLIEDDKCPQFVADKLNSFFKITNNGFVCTVSKPVQKDPLANLKDVLNGKEDADRKIISIEPVEETKSNESNDVKIDLVSVEDIINKNEIINDCQNNEDLKIKALKKVINILLDLI